MTGSAHLQHTADNTTWHQIQWSWSERRTTRRTIVSWKSLWRQRTWMWQIHDALISIFSQLVPSISMDYLALPISHSNSSSRYHGSSNQLLSDIFFTANSVWRKSGTPQYWSGIDLQYVTPHFKSNYLWTTEIMSKGVSDFFGQWVLFEKVSGRGVLLEA